METALDNKPPIGAGFDASAMIDKAYGDPDSLSRRFRAKRFALVQGLIDRIIAEKGQCRIADIGGTPYYWEIAGSKLQSQPVEITLINREAETAGAKDNFQRLTGDATDLGAVDDMSFDLVHSNSVIEHVGDWSKMRAMAETVRRIAPSYYVQTPNFWFPYEPHFRCAFFHWLPEQIRYRLVMRFALGFSDRKENIDSAMARVQSARLIDRGQMRELFPDAVHEAERFIGLTKSLIAVRES